MNPATTCPNCGAAIPPDAPAGVCPVCALSRGLGADAAAGERLAADEAAFRQAQLDALGAAFPQFELLELLGRGGMGEVYKARQKNLNRIVAIKILPEPFGKLDEFTERFRREAQSLARLNHPNIIAIYDFGVADGLCYFVMEYIDGVDLKRTIDAHTLTAAEALRIVPQICDALQFAHEAGIVHRDIKPANILLDRQGRVKIADFGLAKIVGKTPSDLTLTAIGDVMGTPEYMAPEQRHATQSVDHRADIYSLGVVFYEMLTGEVPMGRFEPPSHKVQIDVRLDDIVLRTLEREPARRYQHVSEVRDGVASVTATAAIRSEPAAAARSVERFPVALTALWTLLFAALWWVLGPLWNLQGWGVVAGGVALAGFLGGAVWLSRKRFPIIVEQWCGDTVLRRVFRVVGLVLQCIAVNALILGANLGVKERAHWPRSHLDPEQFQQQYKGEEFKLLRQLQAFSSEIPRAELVPDGFSYSGGLAILSHTPPTLSYYSRFAIISLYLFGLILLANAVNCLIATDFIRLRMDPHWRRTIRPIGMLAVAAALSLVLKFFGSIFTLPFDGIVAKSESATVRVPLEEVRAAVDQELTESGRVLGDQRRWIIHSVPEGRPLARVAVSNAWRPSPFDRWEWRGWRLVSKSPQVAALYLSNSSLDSNPSAQEPDPPKPLETKATFTISLRRSDADNSEARALLQRLRATVEASGAAQ